MGSLEFLAICATTSIVFSLGFFAGAMWQSTVHRGPFADASIEGFGDLPEGA